MGGRIFLREHTAYATSWRVPEVKRIMGISGAMATQMDQCVYGLMTDVRRNAKTMFAKKTYKVQDGQSVLCEGAEFEMQQCS